MGRATPGVLRGCGKRKPGLYLGSGLSENGLPLKHFLICSPQPLPLGMDLINKATLLERREADGNVVINPLTGRPFVDVYIWVGQEHYPEVADFVEEIRRHGASRRVPENIELERLALGSRMIFAHARSRLVNWHNFQLTARCEKEVDLHDIPSLSSHLKDGEQVERQGPCLSKTWELIRTDDGRSKEIEGQWFRTIGESTYPFTPSGEVAERQDYEPGFFLWLNITEITSIVDKEHPVKKSVLENVEQSRKENGPQALPWFESEE